MQVVCVKAFGSSVPGDVVDVPDGAAVDPEHWTVMPEAAPSPEPDPAPEESPQSPPEPSPVAAPAAFPTAPKEA